MHLKKNLQETYYHSIEELPIFYWWKISETGDLKYLFIDGKIDVSLAPEIIETFDKMQDEYFSRYGIDEDFKKVLKLKKEWIKHRTNWILKKDRRSEMYSEMARIDINDLLNASVSKVKKEDTIIMLEEKLSRELDTRKLTTVKYYDYINYYKNGK